MSHRADFDFHGRRAEEAMKMSLADFITPLFDGDLDASGIEVLVEVGHRDGSTCIVKLQASLMEGRARIRA